MGLRFRCVFRVRVQGLEFIVWVCVRVSVWGNVNSNVAKGLVNQMPDSLAKQG